MGIINPDESIKSVYSFDKMWELKFPSLSQFPWSNVGILTLTLYVRNVKFSYIPTLWELVIWNLKFNFSLLFYS